MTGNQVNGVQVNQYYLFGNTAEARDVGNWHIGMGNLQIGYQDIGVLEMHTGD